MYLVQGPLPLMTVDDNPAGRRGNFHLRLDSGRRKEGKTLDGRRIKTEDFFALSFAILMQLSAAFYSTRTSTEYY